MSKKADLMNQYVADLAVLNVKFHNLHWNVVGKRFEAIHVYVEKLYDDLFEKYDEVAERLKMLDIFPVASMKKYLEITKVEEIEDRDYQISEVMQILKTELETLRALSINIRSAADEEDDFGTVAIMEDHVAGFDKELWFITQALK